jgi:hypothetical protein
MLGNLYEATLLSHQTALQVEAAELLAVMSRIDVLPDLGPLLVTGSYVSGLMCWPDLDVGALVGPEFAPADVMDVVARVVGSVEVSEFVYRDERGTRSPTGERRDERFHVPMQVVWNTHEWRFDLSLWLHDDHADVAHWHRQLGKRITPEQRAAVLRIKKVWCRRPEYPDDVSGLEIYNAVLDDNVRTPDGFAAWLVEHRMAQGNSRT